MTECKVMKWDSVATDVSALCKEIEAFLNSQEVKTVHTFTLGRFLVLIAIFKTDKEENL